MALIPDQAAEAHLAALLERLGQIRRRRGDLPQEALAARLGVATNSVTDWEARRDRPSAPHWMAWSRELGWRVAVTDSKGTEITVAANAMNAVYGEPYAYRELRRMSSALRTVRTRQRLSQAKLAAGLA